MNATAIPRPLAAALFSVLAHGAIGRGLDFAPRSSRVEPPPRAFEVEMAPPEPPPVPAAPEPEPEPEPEPASEPEPAPKPVLPEPPEAQVAPEPAATEQPASSEPVAAAEPGFLTAPGGQDGAGLPTGQLGSYRPVARAPVRAPSAPAARPAPPPPPRQVSFKDLSEKPRPPRLDDALRRNYPSAARLQGRAGDARVLISVSSLGQVTAIRVVSASEPAFAEACRRTLLDTRWSAPLDQEGRPVGTLVPYECRFRVTP